MERFGWAYGATGRKIRRSLPCTTARNISPSANDDNSLWAILESTAAETGERYFAGLAQRLTQAMRTCGAWATEYLEETHRLRALAFWMNGNWVEE